MENDEIEVPNPEPDDLEVEQSSSTEEEESPITLHPLRNPILLFDCTFKPTDEDLLDSDAPHRQCKLYIHTEDGSIRLHDPLFRSHSLPMERMRCHRPPPNNDEFYEVDDFEINKEVTLHGRVFKITDCDAQTTSFLSRKTFNLNTLAFTLEDLRLANCASTSHIPEEKASASREGSALSDISSALSEESTPSDISTASSEESTPSDSVYDEVLKFEAVWDDRKTKSGYVHRLTIQYFLFNDTIKITEEKSENCSTPNIFCERGILVKEIPKMPQDQGEELQQDQEASLHQDQVPEQPQDKVFKLPQEVKVSETYHDTDLAVGASIFVNGREILLTSCDDYTKRFKTENGDTYTISNFPPDIYERKAHLQWSHGAYGGSEKQNLKQDSLPELNYPILRFRARTRNTDYLEKDDFVLHFDMETQTIEVYERESGCLVVPSAGSETGTPTKQLKPLQNSSRPKYYTIKDMYIGSTIVIPPNTFRLKDADEFTLGFMEANYSEFPKSNVKLILQKVRKAVDYVLDTFIARYWPGPDPIEYYDFLKSISTLGKAFVDHDVLTLGRCYQVILNQKVRDPEILKKTARKCLKKKHFDDWNLFHEAFNTSDKLNTGHLCRVEIIRILRIADLPFDISFINSMLDVIETNNDGNINYNEVIKFLDYRNSKSIPKDQDMERFDQSEFGVWMPDEEDFPIEVDVHRFVVDLLQADMASLEN